MKIENVISPARVGRKAPHVLMLLCMLMTGLITGCGEYSKDFELTGDQIDAKTVEIIEEQINRKLPPGSVPLNFFYKAPQNPAFLARIEVPATAKQELIDWISLIEVREIPKREKLGDFAWWKPEAGTVFVDRQRMGENQYLRLVLTEQQGKLMLYIEYATY